MKRTKIICTLGPATDNITVLKDLIKNGMNVARLNFSHGDHPSHKIKADIVKKIREELNKPIPLLLDTKGPEVRIKKFKEGKINLEEGNIFTLTTDDIEGDEKIVSVTYENLPEDLNKSDKLLIDDGLIELKVLNISKTNIECEVIHGGIVSNRKSINFPGLEINLPFFSERDKKDVEFGIENDFDFIAASFVRNADCVEEIRKVLDNHKSEIKIISKIENREGVDNIDEIIRVSDAIMIARGDMGVEIPFEEIPGIQKDIIKKCNVMGKPVITATQMLDSMIKNPRPTRAEITDVANAIYDGTSAIMLSGESAVGEFPVEAVQTMVKIAVEAEDDINYIKKFKASEITTYGNITNAISHATCTAAHLLNAQAIITVTKSGRTAMMVSRYRPDSKIIATTISPRVQRQLALSWGVYPILVNKENLADKIFEKAIDKALESGEIKEGDLIVITGSMHVDLSGTTNTLKIKVVGDILLKGEGGNNLIESGNLYVIDSEEAIKNFNANDILVISESTDEILKLINNSKAVITEEKEGDSQAEIVAKALEIPIITGAANATQILKTGTVVTVDAKKRIVFSGIKI